MSALLNSGHSIQYKFDFLTVCFRPQADDLNHWLVLGSTNELENYLTRLNITILAPQSYRESFFMTAN